MPTIQIDEKLYRDISEYCRANDRKIGVFCTDMLRKQFLIEKYGDTPFGNTDNDIRIEESFSSKEEVVSVPNAATEKEEASKKTEANGTATVEPKNNETKIKPRRRVL